MRLKASVCIVLAAGLAAWLIYSFFEWRRHAANAKALGCRLPVRGMSCEPSGVTNFSRGLAASRKKIFLDFLLERMDMMAEKLKRPAGTTVARSPFFRDVIVTNDPENIQAILARQFQEFGLGANRTDNLKPLLGNGIVGLKHSVETYRTSC